MFDYTYLGWDPFFSPFGWGFYPWAGFYRGSVLCGQPWHGGRGWYGGRGAAAAIRSITAIPFPLAPEALQAADSMAADLGVEDSTEVAASVAEGSTEAAGAEGNRGLPILVAGQTSPAIFLPSWDLWLIFHKKENHKKHKIVYSVSTRPQNYSKTRKI